MSSSASIDKLSKSFEYLKIPLQLYDQEQRKQDVKQLAKKDKIANLNLIYDHITMLSMRQSDEYSKMLSLATEAFLAYFDDDDLDIVFVAEECLNKTIKTLLDNNLTRFPADLYRFLRKNGAERSLKGALTRFAELSHLIKPHKCRVYVEFLLKENTLSKIANRSEESIQNVLVSAMNKICSAFCWSMTDNEIKMLMQSFLPNLSNASPANSYRRVAANCLSIICLYSRSPYNSYYYLQQELLNLVLPLKELANNNHQQQGQSLPVDKYTILGVLLCFRSMIIHIGELDKSTNHSLNNNSTAANLNDSLQSRVTSPTSSMNSSITSNRTTNQTINVSANSATSSLKKFKMNLLFTTTNLCEIYELCLYYLSSSDDNRIIQASLECLQVLFKLMPFKFHVFLTNTGAMTESFLNKPIKSSNDETFSNSFVENQSNLENQIAETKFIGQETGKTYPVKSPSTQLGSMYDSNQVQCLYFLRFIAYKYLFNTDESSSEQSEVVSKLKSDRQVKVLVKAIALDCCSNAICLEPKLIFKPLYDDETMSSSASLHMFDLIEYINHSDEKMRTTACQLLGQFINSVLVESCGNFDSWLIKYSCSQSLTSLKLELLLNHLIKFIKLDQQIFTNNICKRFALQSLHSCLPTLIKTKNASLALEILTQITHLRHSTYNLVKCELVDLISSIDFKVVNYVENLLNSSSKSNSWNENEENEEASMSINTKQQMPQYQIRRTQEKLIEDVFLYLLGSDDPKLRLETGKSLARFVINMNFYNACSTNDQRALLALGEFMLKTEGNGVNLLNSSNAENDSFNLSSINLLFKSSKEQQQITNLNSNISLGASSSATNLLHGNRKRQLRYLCSPLSSVSLLSSLPWLSKSNNILNNNFIQPFHSFIKYWPSTSSYTNSIQISLNKVIEHNLNYIIPMLTKTLIQSIDKNLFVGCLESMDFIFQTYAPAIYYSSPISSMQINQATHLLGQIKDADQQSSRQIFDLNVLLLSYLKHPHVSFDLYVHDIMLRLLGTLICSHQWLIMRKIDKLVQQLNFLLNSSNEVNKSNNLLIQQLLDNLTNSVNTANSSNASKTQPQTQAEIATGLTYSYLFAFNNTSTRQVIDQLFVHTMKMLCVFACVIEEQTLPSVLTSNLSAGSTAVTPQQQQQQASPPSASSTSSIQQQNQSSTSTTTTNSGSATGGGAKDALPTRSSSPSFIRAKFNNLTDKTSKNSATSSPTLGSLNGSKGEVNTSIESVNDTSKSDPSNSGNTSTTSLPKTSTNVYLGYFQSSSHYLKIYEISKIAFNSYKKSAHVGVYDRFMQIVKSTLKLFAQLLESALSVHEIGPHLDEILLYLRIIFNIEPSCSVKCVNLCLKSLFSLNLAGLMFDYVQQQINNASQLNTYLLQLQAQHDKQNEQKQQQTATSTSGLSSAMSTSLTSLTSFHTIQMNASNQLNNQNTANLNSHYQQANNKRNQTSIFHSLIQAQVLQFGKLMTTQNLLFKNDQLIGNQMLIASVNQSSLENSSLYSIDYSTNSSSSQSNKASSTVTSLSQPITSSSNQNALSKTMPFGSHSPFNIFNLIRGKNSNSTAQSNNQTKQQQQQAALLDQQQQLLKEKQQQLIKQQKTDLKTIGQYIKSFEAIVIKSLRQYTLTTSVNLQTRILELLTQLIFLKVDYCLLDSDKVFIDYILKQFEYLEQKHNVRDDDENADAQNVLAKSYLIDLYENFDSETSVSDPLNPFDLDTMLNKLVSSFNSNMSPSIGAMSSMSTSNHSIGSSSLTLNSHSPILSNLSLKQQEHQRNYILIPKLFDFLILLSHEKKVANPTLKNSINNTNNNNGLLSVPEIMKLCDNLIASENSPHTHAIPALRPLVIDLFLNRTSNGVNSSDESISSKELDLQHDVIIITLIRLIHYPQIWPLLTLVVGKHKRDNQEKWKKVSRQICDALFDSIRSSNVNKGHKLRFGEFNGNEMRAIRRFSRSYVPHIESLKQLLVLLNCLAPQVYRPIDFILLSLFEVSKSFLLPNQPSYNNSDLNNWLCLIIVHINLLLTHSNEEQILTRLLYLMPQIVDSFRDMSSRPSSNASTYVSSEEASTSENSSSSDDNDTDSDKANNDGLGKYFMDEDENDGRSNKLNLNEPALFLAKFLLRSLEKSLSFVDKFLKFNAPVFISTNLTASSSASNTTLKDYQTNSLRDLNYTQHLINNQLMLLIYICNINSTSSTSSSAASSYPKLAYAIFSLINDIDESERANLKETLNQENETKISTLKKKKSKVKKSSTLKKEASNTSGFSDKKQSRKKSIDIFNFDSSAKYTFKLNEMILFKLSKTNPFTSSMWQYFLSICNYQDPEYWQLSSESSIKIEQLETDLTNTKGALSSNSSSTNNSLNIQSKSPEKHNKPLLLAAHQFKHPTLNEEIFKYLSLTIYCDYISTRNQLDNTTGLTMILVNNLVELFELASHETNIWDLFSTIHRNASASSLFIQSINSNWKTLMGKSKLYLLHSCLRVLEGLHLGSSIHLINLLIDKFFSLPYLSLVRYADHIACQRVEMIHSLAPEELANQLATEQQTKYLNKFFSEQFKYSFRHQRLISLLDQLKHLVTSYNNQNQEISNNENMNSILDSATMHQQTPDSPSPITYIKPSPSIDFFKLYLCSSQSVACDLDKEWFYNLVRNACCYNNSDANTKLSNLYEEDMIVVDGSSLKSKQCALMLCNLDYSNLLSILQVNGFKLSILKDLIMLGAQRTQLDFDKLPSYLKKAEMIHKDLMNPVWSASTTFLFDWLNNFCQKLPQNLVQPSSELFYDLIDKFDFYKEISPISEAINSYLRCMGQYPCLKSQQITNEKINDLISYILFQLTYVNYYTMQKAQVLTLKSVNESFLCVFNLLVDSSLLNALCERTHYSTLVSILIKDIYQLITKYFFDLNDENLIYTPTLSSKFNIDYSKNAKITNNYLFSTHTLDLLLKLRFILTNHKCSMHDVNSSGGGEDLSMSMGVGGGGGSSDDSISSQSSMNATFCASTTTHRFLQAQVHAFRQKLPFNMRDLIDKIFLSICRLPVLERFIRIPDILWRTPGFKVEYQQFLKNDTSTLPPLDYLRDPLILKEHLKHTLTVGWTSRTQFEYEYVNMLTLLHNLSDDYYLPMSSASNQNSLVDSSLMSNDETDQSLSQHHRLVTNLPVEEIKERNKCICLVIKGLSSWLIKSTLTPRSGNSLNSLYEQVSRNKVLGFLHTQLGKQYLSLKQNLEQFNRNNLFTQLNSITISSNSSLLYMLDPTLIDDIDKINSSKKSQSVLDFSQVSQQASTTADSLANLYQISMNLSQSSDYNLLFSTNLERAMIANLSSNSDSYFYFTQISLEGLLKFLGQWNINRHMPPTAASATQTSSTNPSNQINMSSLASSISNLVNDEVSTKTVNVIMKVAEFLSEDTDLNLTSHLRMDRDVQSFGFNHNTVQRSFNRNNLDITSVLRTVLDYYESFFQNPCLQLRLDILKSMLYLGNCLYDSKQQYESLLTKLQYNFEWLNSFVASNDVNSSENVVSELIDESMLSVAIYAESLCKCCLQTSKNDTQTIQMPGKDFERLNKLFENGLKSNSLSIKISTIHGMFYWLECIALGYLVNANDSKQLLDHLCKQVYQIKDLQASFSFATLNARYISTLWSAVFYAIENCLDSIRDAHSFVSVFIKQTYVILNEPTTPYFLFYQLYMGLERFLLSNMLPSLEINTIQRLFTTSKFLDEQKTLCLISLTITSLYASNQSKQLNYWNDIVGESSKKKMNPSQSEEAATASRRSSSDNALSSISTANTGYPQILELNSYPDLQTHLLRVLEVATNFLDKMKSSNTAREASIYASLLPKLLCDFLPPHDLLNKLITEFLNSSQHPYPEAIAFILYKCFSLLQEKQLQSQVIEWCLLSLANFLQRSSIYESMWLTSCLLVSASLNKWLKSTFPFLLNRYCSYETIDRAIFYMSVVEFRKQLSDPQQIKNLKSIFESVSRHGTPYEHVLNLLSSDGDQNLTESTTLTSATN